MAPADLFHPPADRHRCAGGSGRARRRRVIPDRGDADNSTHSPLGSLLGREFPDVATSVRMLLLAVWSGAFVWTIVGLVTTRRSPAPAVYYRPWPGPAPAGLEVGGGMPTPGRSLPRP
jgi:hypothetical protein